MDAEKWVMFESIVDSITERDDLKRAFTLLNERQATLSQRDAAQFSVGDEIEFEDRNGGLLRGHVQKINRKSVGVEVRVVSPTTGELGTQRLHWRVHPRLLKRVEPNPDEKED